MLSGFINLYKPLHISSNKALSILKRSLFENNISTKIGHFGTLDPEAEGVLPVALGRATRLFDYSLDKKKTYLATFTFGVTTDTLDRAGKVTATDDKIITEKDVEEVIPLLVGEIDQIPPLYSAKSVNGVKAYSMARAGKDFNLASKKITVYELKLIKQTDVNVYTFEIICSGGTYIRSIARDMAEKMGTVGYMSALTRTQSGYFSITNALSIEKAAENIQANLISIDEYLSDYPSLIIPEELCQKAKNGVKIFVNNLPDGYFKVIIEEKLYGIGNKNDEGLMEIKTWLV